MLTLSISHLYPLNINSVLGFASSLQYLIKKCVKHGKLTHVGLEGGMQFIFKTLYIKSFELFPGVV